MIIDNGNAKRLGIYFFYDAQGIVDRYVFYFLEGIRPHLSELYIVCNGFVEKKALAQLEQYASGNVMVRENRGLDVGAYRAVIECIGFDRLEDYDELILMNYTMYGPLIPFTELFETMSARNLDFWGITSHAGVEGNPFPQNGMKDLPEHIQSYFLAIRKGILCAPAFQEYWDALPEIKTYSDSVGFYECTFTRHFSALGFRWATYTGTEQMAQVSPQPIMAVPLSLVRECRCPIVKRRSFFQDYDDLLSNTNGTPGSTVLAYIRDCLDYDVELIWENLLRTCNHAVLRRCLHLNYILPDQFVQPALKPPLRVALWMHIYYMDLLPECFHYASAMPERAEVIVTTDTLEKKSQIESMFSKLPVRRFEVILIENRGRDNSALLVGCAPFLDQYDIVCFAHDKKASHLKYEVQGQSFSEHCYENTLKSREFAENVIQTFSENPRLGLLCPPPPYASAYYNTIGISDWGPNFENTKDLYDRLGLWVPISEDVEPVAPFGSVFWFRTSALASLFRHGWTYEDFPAEPVDFDGTFLHAIERIYPFVAQQAGYYSGWLLSSSFAAVELTNYHYMLRQLNVRLVPTFQSADFHELCKRAEHPFSGLLRACIFILKCWLKKHLPENVYQALRRVKKVIFRQP